jgi:hypothetical protein
MHCTDTPAARAHPPSQWRELSARRYVFRGLNEQLRRDVQDIMVYVARSVEASENKALDAVVSAAEARVATFR